MKKNKYSTISQRGSRIFLMEIIIAILFLSLVSAFCLRIFVQAHIYSKETRDLNRAIAFTSSISDLLLASKNVTDATDTLTAIYPETTILADTMPTLHIYLTEDGNSCGQSDAVYMAIVSKEYSINALTTWKISIYNFTNSDSSSNTIINTDSDSNSVLNNNKSDYSTRLNKALYSTDLEVYYEQ